MLGEVDGEVLSLLRAERRGEQHGESELVKRQVVREPRDLFGLKGCAFLTKAAGLGERAHSVTVAPG